MATFNVKNFNLIIASMVNWMANNQSKITDFNVGSVTRTMLESVALELEEVYFRLYRSIGTSIAEAVYTAFDFPKLPPVRATGRLKFSRSTAAQSDIDIFFGTLVQTQNAKQYEVVDNNVLIAGPQSFEVDEFEDDGGDYYIYLKSPEGDKTRYLLGGDTVEIPAGGSQAGTYTLSANATYGSSRTKIQVVQSVSNEGPPPLVATTLDTAGKTEVTDVSARAINFGEEYNVDAGTINRFATPILGVETVTNITAMTGGAGVETDVQRMSRFNQYIQSLARGTLYALEFAAINVPGVITAKAVDSRPVFVIVYVAGGFNPGTIVDDYSEQANAPHEQQFDMLDTPPTSGSFCVIASEVQFDTVYIELSVQGVYAAGAGGVWEYLDTNSIWQDLTPYIVSDETNKLTQTGALRLISLGASSPLWSDWGNTTFQDGNPDEAQGKTLFPIRFRATSDYSTLPTCIQMFTKPEPGTVNLFASQEGAVLPDDIKTKIEQSADDYRAAGINVTVLGPTKKEVTVRVAVRVNPAYKASDVLDVVRARLASYTSAFALGQSIYDGDLISHIMRTGESVLDTEILELDGRTPPNVEDVIASPNQLLVIDDSTILGVEQM